METEILSLYSLELFIAIIFLGISFKRGMNYLLGEPFILFIIAFIFLYLFIPILQINEGMYAFQLNYRAETHLIAHILLWLFFLSVLMSYKLILNFLIFNYSYI